MGSASSVLVVLSSSKAAAPTDEINENKLCVPFHKFEPTSTTANTCGYVFDYKIGEGAFSDVRAGHRKDNNEKVCIKEIKLIYYTDEFAHESLYEFNILSQLSHPDIVKIYEVFFSKNIYYMVTELLFGGELFDAICERETYSEGDARKVMQTVTESLRYCHSRNVIHRDIKPENIILQDKTMDAKVKLIDFGFARVMGDEAFTHIRGSAMYLSPEMIAGSYKFPTDVWSLGVVFYIMLSGMYPFESASGDVNETKEIISRGKYSFPPQHWSGISLQAQDLINEMLTYDPQARITMAGVLKHPWMTNQKNKTVDLTKNIAAIKTFQKNKRMKAASLAVRATMILKTSLNTTLKKRMMDVGKLQLQSLSTSNSAQSKDASVIKDPSASAGAGAGASTSAGASPTDSASDKTQGGDAVISMLTEGTDFDEHPPTASTTNSHIRNGGRQRSLWCEE